MRSLIKNSYPVWLLVPPGGYYASRWESRTSMPPLGIGYVAASLDRAGIGVTCVDSYVENIGYRNLKKLIKDNRPQLKIVGVTFTTENRFDGFKTIRAVKKADPDIITIAGGPHASLAAEDTLSHINELDFVVIGEGDHTMIELTEAILNEKPYQDIHGIAYRDDSGKVVTTESRPFIQDLNTLPFPARHTMPMDKYRFMYEVPGKGILPAANIMTSRGCPFGCNFCSSSLMWGKRVRMRSIENIMAEVEELVEKYNAGVLWIFDDTFNITKHRVHEFCDALLERNIDLSWFCEIRVDAVDKELLLHMKSAGAFSVAFGVESGSQRIIDEVIGKKISLDMVRQIASWCDEIDLHSNPFFIFSHPEETWEDLDKTVALMDEWPKSGKISLSLLHVYPGTRLEALARSKGILPEDFSWSVKNDPRIEMLPAAQGHVPIFRDKLSWSEINKMMFKWAEGQKYPIWNKIPKVLLSIHSFHDFKRYAKMALDYLRMKLF